MVFETIRSLQMEPCVLYVGTVKRRNIGFDIRQLQPEEGETYDKAKQRVVSARIEGFLDGHKTLLYYPFAGGIDLRLKSWVGPADAIGWLRTTARKTKSRRKKLCAPSRRARKS